MREHLRHLAKCGQVRRVRPNCPWEAACDARGSNGRCIPRGRDGAEDPTENLSSRAEDDGVEIACHRLGVENLRCDLGIRGTAGIEEKTRVVRLSRGLLVDSETTREP